MSGVVRLHEHGGPDVLQYELEQLGEPAAGQVRLRHDAIGVNFVDTYFRSGSFPLRELPAVIGGEGSGVVDAVGPDVESVSIGDRVGYYFSLGAYAERRLLAVEDTIPLPDDISSVDAAALLAQGLTAWARLRRVHPVQAGEVVLVTGATGGVGSLLATWAQHLGARVIALVAGPDRVEAARALGLKHIVVAATGELASAVAAAGGGVDVFYDQVGRATFAEAVSVLRDGGTLDLLGAASGEPELDVAELNRRRIRITRSSTGEHLPDRETLLNASDELFQAWRDGVFGTRQVHTYPLSKAAQAHHDLEARITGAAIVLLPDGTEHPVRLDE
ncbi:zinc-binding dehydrogenase [Nonomuraea sp. K274]|uniref:Zinc-binding dehydrogenase n=2 Tax=Nonomuraea cypriaca TaxID=1187855 RepID=A0A931F3I3_9ACTN|nr:zinc-binding dehydrogenase [Nonomuraea cypriaca]